MNAAFTFPARTGDAQLDGLALLRHTIAYGVTPVNLEDAKLALHVAPLAYLGAPAAWTVASVNKAVDSLAAAVRRLTVTEADEKAARTKKLAQLFDGLDDRPNQGPMAPVSPTPDAPTPPAPPVNPLDTLAEELSRKAGINLDEARKLIRERASVKLAGRAA